MKIIQWLKNVLSTICMAQFPLLQASFRQPFMENAADCCHLTDFIRTLQLQSTTVIYFKSQKCAWLHHMDICLDIWPPFTAVIIKFEKSVFSVYSSLLHDFNASTGQSNGSKCKKTWTEIPIKTMIIRFDPYLLAENICTDLKLAQSIQNLTLIYTLPFKKVTKKILMLKKYFCDLK